MTGLSDTGALMSISHGLPEVSPAEPGDGARLAKGIGYALVTGLLWGMVFLAPAVLNDYGPAAHAFGRYVAFGLIALLAALPGRSRLAALRRADWHEAFKLALVGNIIYFLLLAAAVQAGGVPLVSVIVGLLPLSIAVCANWQDRSVPWSRLLPSLVLIAAGITLINQGEMAQLAQGELGTYALGAVLAVGAMLAWTWYPIRNARWLKAQPHLSAGTWATAQGLATLPMAVTGWLGLMVWQALQRRTQGVEAASLVDWLALGPRPALFITVMLLIGLLASWLGTQMWSRASQLLPTSLTGQLIVFETVSALIYGYSWRGQWPESGALLGIGLLLGGVVLGVQTFQAAARQARTQTA